MSYHFYTITLPDGRQFRACVPAYRLQKAADLLGVPVSQLSRGADAKLPEWKG